ncbi:MAG TPA: hypothetical protein IGR15_06665 [Synechococcus sp. M44_DOE_062]|nr:hypothetical protein [Synechococcus sp. M44_DOE_062]
MPKSGCRGQGAVLRGALSLVVIVLVGLLVGCGPRPPKPIVQQALAYQIAHVSGPVGSLVGIDQLPARLEVQDVKIRQDRREPLLLVSGETLEGHHLSGTYTLIVHPPGSRRPYRRKGDPFQITLAHQKAQTVARQWSGDQESDGVETVPERWLLAYSSPDSKTWKVIDFLPQPALAPEWSPAKPEPTMPATAPAAVDVGRMQSDEALNRPSSTTAPT